MSKLYFHGNELATVPPSNVRDFVATTERATLYEEEDPWQFYLAYDKEHKPDWEAASKALKPRPGIVVVEMLRSPTKLGEILLPSIAYLTRVLDEAVAGFESSVGVVLAVGPHEKGDPDKLPLPIKPGQYVLCCDGDGVEVENLVAGGYKSEGFVRMFGRVQPAENDMFTLPYEGFTEELPWHESIVAVMEGEDKDMIVPTGHNVLVRKDPFKTRSEAGLLLPDVGQERGPLATIVAKGPEVLDVEVGDRVIYHPQGELSFRDGDDPDLRLTHEDAILTVIELEASIEA